MPVTVDLSKPVIQSVPVNQSQSIRAKHVESATQVSNQSFTIIQSQSANATNSHHHPVNQPVTQSQSLVHN
eukprot:4971271-Lingulodinium_polyedra.AAC.1